MTAEKKWIIRKIAEIEAFIEADTQLGCGFAPANWYDPLYEEIHQLEDRLARLRGFKDAEAERAFYETLPMNVQATIFGWY